MDLTYFEKLLILNGNTLERKRPERDLIVIYKLKYGLVNYVLTRYYFHIIYGEHQISFANYSSPSFL